MKASELIERLKALMNESKNDPEVKAYSEAGSIDSYYLIKDVYRGLNYIYIDK